MAGELLRGVGGQVILVGHATDGGGSGRLGDCGGAEGQVRQVVQGDLNSSRVKGRQVAAPCRWREKAGHTSKFSDRDCAPCSPAIHTQVSQVPQTVISTSR